LNISSHVLLAWKDSAEKFTDRFCYLW
jgi:hypothetical protein